MDIWKLRTSYVTRLEIIEWYTGVVLGTSNTSDK